MPRRSVYCLPWTFRGIAGKLKFHVLALAAGLALLAAGRADAEDAHAAKHRALAARTVPPGPTSGAPEVREVLVVLRPGTDVKQFARDHGLTLVRSMRSDPQGYVFAAASGAEAEAVVRAGPARPEGGATRAAAPGVAADPRLAAAALNTPHRLVQYFTADDTYYSNQWYLENASGPSVNVAGAWGREVTGAGVVLAIVDDGLQTTHPDLSPNYDAADSYNFVEHNADPSPGHLGDAYEDRHGTACAGVAAARGGNGIGVCGTAPYASLAGLRLDFYSVLSGSGSISAADQADAIRYHSYGANTDIKVKSHSYGDAQRFVNYSTETSALADSAAAGTLHCFAAGNDRNNLGEDCGTKAFQSSPNAICIAALGSDGKYASYSNFGACVFATAPSSSNNAGCLSIYSTDLMTEAYGYNGASDALANPDYTSIFGTSSSCALAAGVLTLAKQAQPGLNVRFAKHLLVRSCDQVDASDSSVTSDGGWKTNSAGNKFNQNYGFGLLNADKLTLEALKFTSVTAQTTETKSGAPAASIPDGNLTGVSTTFAILSTTALEDVLVTLGITHPWRGDLSAFITSPRGTTSRLLYPRVSNDNGSNLNWTFCTNAFWGENPSGTWTLKVVDNDSGSTGAWNTYSVTVRMGSLIADTTPPTVAGVTSTVADGAYGLGAVVPVCVVWSKPAFVTGTPRITLETGATDAVVDYSSGSGTNTLVFNYTPAPGQNCPHLDYLDANALALSGGTIRDAAGSSANLALPAPGAPGSLGANKNLAIDTVVPGAAGVTSALPDGTYGVGAVVDVRVAFSEPVYVNGVPQVTLETGPADAVVNYSSGSGSNTLVFNYTVQPGHASPDLDYVSPAALALNGGTIRDVAGNNATLTLSAPGAPGSLGGNQALVIETTPVVASVAPASGLDVGGLRVTIHGNNFSSTATVAFGGATASGLTLFSVTDLACTLPPHVAGLVAVTVTDIAGQNSTLADAFTYLPSPPAITTVLPNLGTQRGGQPVTLSGSAFRTGVTVSFGDAPAVDLVRVSATQLTCTTPAHGPATVDVLAVNSDTTQGVKTGGYVFFADYEADVSARDTGGDGKVTISDWVQIGRFAVELDPVTPGFEFQKADCAPRETSGDGIVSVADWVQAGRYAAALDGNEPAAGPTAPAP